MHRSKSWQKGHPVEENLSEKIKDQYEIIGRQIKVIQENNETYSQLEKMYNQLLEDFHELYKDKEFNKLKIEIQGPTLIPTPNYIPPIIINVPFIPGPIWTGNPIYTDPYRITCTTTTDTKVTKIE